jgi:hypothetical protein
MGRETSALHHTEIGPDRPADANAIPSRPRPAMLVIPDFLTTDEIGEIDRLMDSAPYEYGHHTATGQAWRGKKNRRASRS